jgi:hypothetical protein
MGLLLTLAGCGRFGFDDLPTNISDAPVDSTLGDGSDVSIDAMVDALVDASVDAMVPADQGACATGERQEKFTTNFDDGLPGMLQEFATAPARLRLIDMIARLEPGESASIAYATLSSTLEDFRERRVWFDVLRMVNIDAMAVVNPDALFAFREATRTAAFELIQTGGTLFLRSITDGGASLIFTGAYRAANHRFWQIRERLGTLLFEVSADGLTWAALTSVATPTWFNNATFEIAAGGKGLVMPGEFRIDNLTDCKIR